MNLKKKEEKPMQTKENLSQTVKDVKVEIIKDVFKKRKYWWDLSRISCLGMEFQFISRTLTD